MLFCILPHTFKRIYSNYYIFLRCKIASNHRKTPKKLFFLVPRLHFPARKKVTTQQEDFKNNCKPVEISIFKMHGQEEPCRSYSINLYHCLIAKLRATILIIRNWDTFYLAFIHQSTQHVMHMGLTRKPTKGIEDFFCIL